MLFSSLCMHLLSSRWPKQMIRPTSGSRSWEVGPSLLWEEMQSHLAKGIDRRRGEHLGPWCHQPTTLLTMFSPCLKQMLTGPHPYFSGLTTAVCSSEPVMSNSEYLHLFAKGFLLSSRALLCACQVQAGSSGKLALSPQEQPSNNEW